MAKIKEGFKGERLVSMPEKLLEDYRKEPLIAPLHVRKIGFFPASSIIMCRRTRVQITPC